MCWNKTISAVTLGVGFGAVMLGILWIRDRWFTFYSITFLYLLMMQLAELIAYIAKDAQSSDAMHYATQLALLANITQPLIAGLVLLPLTQASDWSIYLCLAILTAYSIWLCVMASTTMDKYTVISKNMSIDPRSEPCFGSAAYPGTMAYYGKRLEYRISKRFESFFGPKEEDCHSHIIYPWWRQISPVPYLVALGAVIVLLIRPISFAIYTFVMIFGVLLFSVLVFNDGEVGSQWCFFVVTLCIINPFAYWLLVGRGRAKIGKRWPKLALEREKIKGF